MSNLQRFRTQKNQRDRAGIEIIFGLGSIDAQSIIPNSALIKDINVSSASNLVEAAAVSLCLFLLSVVVENTCSISDELTAAIKEIGTTTGHEIVTISKIARDRNQSSGDNLGERLKNFSQFLKKYILVRK
ncbi:hypothetical protein ACE1CD_08705 [Aerosakkonema sp. BLCC-F183]|uniref:hypothetical protein n=1 Tax=Aerosakkonema sp. BLCC-F183 TaxID=3342834 RepID=UPI0035B937F5